MLLIFGQKCNHFVRDLDFLNFPFTFPFLDTTTLPSRISGEFWGWRVENKRAYWVVYGGKWCFLVFVCLFLRRRKGNRQSFLPLFIWMGDSDGFDLFLVFDT